MGSLLGRKILVTAGGTCEFIDNIRIITNISTGSTARHIAEELLNRDAEVFYIRAKGAESPVKFMHSIYTEINIVTAQDLMDQMKKYITEFDIDTVIHAAAVSDFTFKRDGDIKLSSSSPEAFIKYLRKTIQKTPKIIKLIKEWNPKVKLIGFKFTVGKLPSELFKIARAFRKDVGADIIIANDQVEMEKTGIHIAHLVASSDCFSVVAEGNKAIAENIANCLEGSLSIK